MQLNTSGKLIDISLIKNIYKERNPFSHKGDYGHAALFAGSFGMMGAAVLSAKACLRSGVGKLTCYIPEVGYDIMQISAPEAMVNVSGTKIISDYDELKNYDSIGIGPGIGFYQQHKKLLKKIFTAYKQPVIIDADALNIIAANNKLLKNIPAESIITPHPKEFEKLFGVTKSEEDRLHLAQEKSFQYKIYVVLKGHHTIITTPDKKVFFNSTGNAGMATGGSGDVLTGILTGLLSQGFSSLQTCLFGVYIHGLAGDIAAKNLSQEAIIAGDIINYLGEAFKQIGTV